MYEPTVLPLDTEQSRALMCKGKHVNRFQSHLHGSQRRKSAGAMPIRRGIATATFTALAMTAGLAAAPDAAAQTAAAANTPQAAATTFQNQAQQLGIKSCAGLLAGMGDSLTRGASYTSTLQAQKDGANDHAAQAVVGMNYDTPNYKGQAAGVVFASPTKSGCEGGLVRVAPFPQACPDVVKQLPPGSTLNTLLSGTPLYTLGGNQGQALLVPSGTGCVVVTVASAMDRR